MCLNTIENRLKNNYYRGHKSLEFDIELLVSNSIKFNDENHKITKTAKNIK
jgi:hypothetical protein